MAKGSIPAKSTKDLEFCKYITENILNNFGKNASRKREKTFCPQQHKVRFKEWNRNMQILWSLSVYLISVISKRIRLTLGSEKESAEALFYVT